MKPLDIYLILKVAFTLFCAMADAQEPLSVQLRTQGRLYTDAADTLDQQIATITSQAAKIAELEARIAELRGDLKAEDFTYLGKVNVPNVGQQCGGLAYDPGSQKWYTVGSAGNNPFNLCEFKLDVATLTATNVVSRGPLNVSDVLRMNNQALPQLKGLLFDRFREAFQKFKWVQVVTS